MTQNQAETLIEILGKSYSIKCPLSEVSSLLRTAKYLEEKMQQIKATGITQPDKITIMAALNITHELLNFENQKEGDMHEFNQRLCNLHNKIDDALINSQSFDSLKST